jgi:hypothetical protein
VPFTHIPPPPHIIVALTQPFALLAPFEGSQESIVQASESLQLDALGVDTQAPLALQASSVQA